MKSFFDELFDYHNWLRTLPLIQRSGAGWQGIALVIPPPAGSNLGNPLDIEVVGNEVTISLDYSHGHMEWPKRPGDSIWLDALKIVDGIFNEEIVALSGWIDGKLRVGSMRQVGMSEKLLVPDLHVLRVRSWRGRYDRDDVLLAVSKQ